MLFKSGSSGNNLFRFRFIRVVCDSRLFAFETTLLLGGVMGYQVGGLDVNTMEFFIYSIG